MKNSLAALLCLAVQVAAAPAWAGGAPSQSAAASEACPLPPGWDAIAARKPRFVIFGEMHGTEQTPAFFGDVACALATKGERILVALELSPEGNPALQKVWRLPVAQFPAALQQIGWAGANDGKDSEAMLAMLLRLHALAQQTHRIDIVAFNGAKDDAQRRRFADLPGQDPHEAAQAENIRIAADARPYDRVLVLVGGAHAHKRPVPYPGGLLRPMAMHLAPPETIVALEMMTAGGSTWSCQARSGVTPPSSAPVAPPDVTCGAFPAPRDADLERPPFIALGPLPGSELAPGIDGVFWVGKVSASPPVAPRK
ncbi:hypothetical protein [Sphingomonas sp. 3-13AW]|jgi:hypothetical protein|uniref:hypothetical protein n=1 Tax=Sphingomonas sp. 3-13AW TaxID=3050450 RepID=UPI003BB7CEDF